MLKQSAQLNPSDGYTWRVLADVLRATNAHKANLCLVFRRSLGNTDLSQAALQNPQLLKFLGGTLVSYSGAFGDANDFEGEEAQLRCAMALSNSPQIPEALRVPEGEICADLGLLLAQCLLNQKKPVQAAEILREIWGKPIDSLYHMFQMETFNARGLGRLGSGLYTGGPKCKSAFVRVAFELLELAWAKCEEADAVYLGPGSGNHTEDSVRLYLEGLSYTWKGMMDR